MAVTIDLTGVSPSHLTVVASPLAELQACLHALAEPDHHMDARRWLEHIGGQLSMGLRADLMRFAPLWARRRSRLLLPLAHPSPVPLETELTRVEEVPDEQFVDSMAHTVAGGGDVETAGILDDEDCRRTFVEACDRRSFSRGDLARTLVADPVSFRDALLATLRRCREEFFDAEWTRLEGRITDEVARLRAFAHTSAADVLCAVSPSATRIGETATVRFDKLQDLRVRPRGRAVFLVPTMVGRPHLIVRDDEPFPVVIQFPVGSVTGPGTFADIQHTLATLSDTNRLTICRHLVNEAITTSDLARRTGMPASQVSRHLARLRAVGLLISERDGRFVHHRLDVATVMQLGPHLIASIVQ